MHATPRSLIAAVGFAVLLAVAGCSDDDDGSGPPVDGLTVAKAIPSGDAQTATVAEALANPLRVLVTMDGTPEAGRTVQWSAMAGMVAPVSGTTGADGIAEATWTLGPDAGPQGAQATVAGASGSPVSFGATAVAGPASSLATVSGGGQAGRIGTEAGAPLIVRVDDALGNPVAGVGVAFAVTAGSATVGTPNATTGAAGEAQSGLTFGATAGQVTVEATSGTLTGSPRTFTAESGHVVVINDQFSLNAVTVPAGTTVRWVWGAGAVGHNITPVGGAEPTATASASNSAPFIYEHTFNTPGVYDYQCTNHVGMNGTITVQ